MDRGRAQNPKSWPLWLQLTAGMLAIMLLVALLGGEFMRGLQRQQLLETTRAEARGTLELLAAATLKAAITEDIPQLETIVGQVAGAERDIYRVQVSNEDGIALVRWQHAEAVAESDLLSYDQAILLEGESFGSLQVTMDMTRPFSVALRVLLTAAQQGGLGLELAQAHLPDIHGLQVREQLLEQANTRDIPVILVSADTQPDTIKRSQELSVADYFTKPLDVPRLLQCIDRILQSNASQVAS